MANVAEREWCLEPNEETLTALDDAVMSALVLAGSVSEVMAELNDSENEQEW